MSKIDLEALRAWVGRTEMVEDVASLRQAQALAATLDLEAVFQEGDELPPLWHWIYFTPLVRQSQLGADGHPKRGGFLPPIALPRRMWAGGRLSFHAPIRLGSTLRRTTEIINVDHKQGRQGELVFLTLSHCVTADGALSIEEEQDIVYRDASAPKAGGEGTPPSVGDPVLPVADWRDPGAADPLLLFRYSALTFNAHRIHYDAPYARGVEGYPDLVVHGPLSATLLAGAIGRHAPGALRRFSFRGQQPLFVAQPFSLCGRREKEEGGWALWTEAAGGAPLMSAQATIASP